eukprot:2161252-Karenia_brevis.AAC.1
MSCPSMLFCKKLSSQFLQTNMQKQAPQNPTYSVIEAQPCLIFLLRQGQHRTEATTTEALNLQQ